MSWARKYKKRRVPRYYEYSGNAPIIYTTISPDIVVRVGEATKGINVVMTTTSPRTLRFYLPLIAR